MLFDVDAGRAAMIAASLAPLGPSILVCDRPAGAREALLRESPALAVVVGGGGESGTFAGLASAARDRRIPTLAVVEPGDDPRALAARVRGHDEWATLSGPATEIPARVAGLLDRAEGRPSGNRAAGAPELDSRFLALVVHDLRTPLNVIGLTIRAIAQSTPQRTPEFEEDLTFLTENARQIEKMLAQIGDLCRLMEAGAMGSGTEFDPRRFLSDFLEDRQGRSGVEATPVRLEVADSCPPVVTLDPIRTRLALQHALANAVAAAGDAPVRVRASGQPGRWVVEMVIDKPPPATVVSIPLRPEVFERLAGSAAERRGLDLSIAARISELFGGSARLDVEPGRGTTVVLDWPERLATT